MQTRVVIDETIDDIRSGLGPFIESVFARLAPDGQTWQQAMARRAESAGDIPPPRESDDVALMLRVLIEKLDGLGFLFDERLSPQGASRVTELHDAYMRHLRQSPFTIAETYRTLDSAELLLREVGASEQSARVASRKPRVLAELSRGGRVPLPPPPDAPQGVAPVPARTAPVLLSVDAVGELSYAMAHARIVPIQEVRIGYAGQELRGASLEVQAQCAGGPIGDPKVVIIDLAPGELIIAGADLLTLDPARVLQVDTEQPGAIEFVLRGPDGTALTRHRHPVTVLAANQWIARELHLGLELLAAFVQPQSPALTSLMQDAAERLGRATGRTALDGYQSDDPARVDGIVEAIWDAVRARGITYAEPPASWGLRGQKVRTPSEVLDGRLGTCLDTVLTVAALLELAGINSTLWLAEGHIFLGYWREDATLGFPATTDVEVVVNLVDLGRIGVLETTKLTGGAASATLDDAKQVARTYLQNRLGDVLGVTDIRGARESRIFPLPSRGVAADGSVTIVEYHQTDRVIGAFVAGAREPRPAGQRQPPARVTQWKNALLDLSLRNRLINFTDAAGHQLAVPGEALARLEDMISNGHAVTLLASDDVPQIAIERGHRYGRDRTPQEREKLLVDRRQAYTTDITRATFTTHLRALASKAKTITEETGANNLYLAFGTLRWVHNDRELRSPLVLVPVNLESVARGASFRLSLDESGASTPNYCLIEKLRVSHGIEIPGLQDPESDAAGIDLAAAFRAVRQAMVDGGAPFVVEETVHLAVLQFAKFRLWKDLDESWAELARNRLVDHLIHTPNDAFVDDALSPTGVDLDLLATQVPVAADSSQLEAVSEAVAGRTFVLEGPPGTGKSQTITNLLARSLAEGKRVLFVAEKRAALDVVKQRLDEVGLGVFSLDLHDKGARPNAVREQLRAALDASARPDLAALTTQREVAEASRGALARYAQRVHEPNAAGLSLYSAREQVLASAADIAALELPPAFVASATDSVFSELRTCLRLLPAVSDLARPSVLHPWGFIDRADDIDASVAHSAAREFDRALLAAGDRDLTISLSTPEQADAWAGATRAPRYPIDAIDALALPAAAAELARIRGELDEVVSQPPNWLAQLDAAVLGHNPAGIHAAAVAADGSSIFGRKKRRRAVLQRLAADLRVDQTAIRLRDLSVLTSAIADTSARTEAVADALRRLPVSLAGPEWNPFLPGQAEQTRSDLDWLGWLARTLAAPDSPVGELRPALRGVYSEAANPAAAVGISALADAWRALAVVCHTGAPDTTAADRLTSWSEGIGMIRAWGQTRAARNLDTSEPVTLGRWLDLLRHVEPLRAYGLHGARVSILTGTVRAEDASLAFDKGIAEASLLERADATALSEFDPEAHGRAIGRFTASASAIRGELPRAIPADILGRRQFDPSYDGGDMGALKRQLARQRGGDGVRVLMEKYGELITRITPCMLMSPESVARFFPARVGMFDIVVFDEASQIRVADAVGAMGRARSVVVVGDSKQMPPSSFAEISIDTDEGTHADAVAGVVLDEESILTECTQARVPSKWLSWHYRSQDEALIAFSNHQYYEGRLSSFPAPLRVQPAPSAPAASRNDRFADHGISLVRVAGRFDRSGKHGALRTNVIEAQAIVDEVSRRFDESRIGTPSLGVITFNVQQRALIENMLRDAADERIGRALDERDGLFVKNLESVQGDERDTILFSVAFSHNDRGLLPLNFGPLSRAGGERRLNVAITRARRQVVLYASFDASDLRAEQTSARGIKDLKSYLQLAQRGVESADGSSRRVSTVDRHRDEIAQELRRRGIVVQTDVGLSDFRIDLSLALSNDPTQPLVAVLLDGPGWRARRTVADRDGLPVDVLGGVMRWPGVERIWLPEWLADRDEVVERLVAALDDAAEGAVRSLQDEPQPEVAPLAWVRSPAEPPDGDDAVTSADFAPGRLPLLRAVDDANGFSPIPAARRHAHVDTFVPWTPRSEGRVTVLDALPAPAASKRVREALVAVVEAEGPVSKARLARLVAESFGLSRVSVARAAAILRLLPVEHEREGDDEFAWPAGADPKGWRRVRVSDNGGSRPLDHIPLEEIANAMAVVAQLGGGMREEDITREALGLLGGKRMTPQASERLAAALVLAMQSRRIEKAGSGALVAVVTP